MIYIYIGRMREMNTYFVPRQKHNPESVVIELKFRIHALTSQNLAEIEFRRAEFGDLSFVTCDITRLDGRQY